MGCTSSAPNVAEITANTTETTENEKSTGEVKENEDPIHGAIESDLKDTNVSKVLPTCDSLEENIQLARNSNSYNKIDDEQQEQGDQQINVVENKEMETEDQREHNKLSTLKDVAEQVILNTIFDDLDQSSIVEQETSNNKVENVVSDTEEKSTELIEESSDEQLDTDGQDNIKESTSPSQSDGNRSTRWEALADIAAELPPSLAVDPITGQIYSLAK